MLFLAQRKIPFVYVNLMEPKHICI